MRIWNVPGRSSITVSRLRGEGAARAHYRAAADVRSPNGLCDEHQVIPAFWRLTFPDGVRGVANSSDDPAYPRFSSLLTCRGNSTLPSRSPRPDSLRGLPSVVRVGWVLAAPCSQCFAPSQGIALSGRRCPRGRSHSRSPGTGPQAVFTQRTSTRPLRGHRPRTTQCRR